MAKKKAAAKGKDIVSLRDCDPYSLIAAVMTASQLGLEIGINGQAYLVAYGREVTLIPGYRGLITLAIQSGVVNSIEARAVHEKDRFTFCYGTAPDIQHDPEWLEDPGDVVAVYAVARLAGGLVFDVMSKREVDSIRARSKAGKYGPWQDDYEEMARKTVVRRLCKYLPMSVDKAQKFSAALELDDAANSGHQGLTIDAAKNGTWVAPDEVQGEPDPDVTRGEYQDAFNALDWNKKEQDAFLEKHKHSIPADIRHDLNRLVDERNAGDQ